MIPRAGLIVRCFNSGARFTRSFASFQWGYSDKNGPAQWPKHFLAGQGKRQSPVDFCSTNSTFTAELKNQPFKLQYPDDCVKTLTNNGRSIQVGIEANKTSLKGGPLDDEFQAEQFHFHWGSTDQKGSEHTVEGKRYASEFHLVHFNKSKYGKFADAVDKSDGLCVLGAFIRVDDVDNPAFSPIIEALSNVKQKGQTTSFTNFNIRSLLPDDIHRYWTYLGSLTTPPLLESVHWVVFKTSIPISKKQIAEMRSLLDGSGGNIIDNFRPPQPLHGRQIRSSFRMW